MSEAAGYVTPAQELPLLAEPVHPLGRARPHDLSGWPKDDTHGLFHHRVSPTDDEPQPPKGAEGLRFVIESQREDIAQLRKQLFDLQGERNRYYSAWATALDELEAASNAIEADIAEKERLRALVTMWENEAHAWHDIADREGHGLIG